MQSNLVYAMLYEYWWNMDSQYIPEIKQQSKQRTESGESAPKKVKTLPSAEKVMVIVLGGFK